MRAAIDTVSGNRSLARLLTAYLVNVLVEHGHWIALLVYAYHRGGASEAGLVAIAQLLPSIALGPVLIAHGKRFGIVRLLVISFAVEAVSRNRTISPVGPSRRPYRSSSSWTQP